MAGSREGGLLVRKLVLVLIFGCIQPAETRGMRKADGVTRSWPFSAWSMRRALSPSRPQDEGPRPLLHAASVPFTHLDIGMVFVLALCRTLGRDFIRVGHHAMGAVQLTLFARREMLDRVKVRQTPPPPRPPPASSFFITPLAPRRSLFGCLSCALGANFLGVLLVRVAYAVCFAVRRVSWRECAGVRGGRCPRSGKFEG